MGSYYKCRECGEVSPESQWRETEVGCEECGTHGALACPLCDEAHDTVLPGCSPIEVESMPVEPPTDADGCSRNDGSGR